jgi:predicted P-loop ATPase
MVLITDAPQYAALHFDEFLSCMRLGGRDWTDDDDLEAVCWLQSKQGVPHFGLRHARNGARAAAYARRRDSLLEFVDTLPPWDNSPRIDMALVDAWGAPDNSLTRAASRNFFVAMIARAKKPGAKVDSLWCLEAAQGKLKSMSLRELGGDFHAEITAAIGTTDFMRELRGI